MIEMVNDTLIFTFPEIHENARLEIAFQRTLRIPDDGGTYPLPPGFDTFPLRHVDDFPGKVSSDWIRHGGVMLPMYQSEAMWLSFESEHIDDHDASYPFAVKIATGKQSAVTGEEWKSGLHTDPQDYMAIPDQPWLDGYVVEEGKIRQFVAMPLGAGYTAEEQLTGKAEHGGLQIQVFPMKRKVFDKLYPKVEQEWASDSMQVLNKRAVSICFDEAIGLAPGGLMRQEIHADPHGLQSWDLRRTGRCFIHLANSLLWRQITGENPPTTPPTAQEYNDAGLPWFDYYSDKKAIEGSKFLNGMKSVAKLGEEKGELPLPENQSVSPEKIVALRKGLGDQQVREGKF